MLVIYELQASNKHLVKLVRYSFSQIFIQTFGIGNQKKKKKLQTREFSFSARIVSCLTFNGCCCGSSSSLAVSQSFAQMLFVWLAHFCMLNKFCFLYLFRFRFNLLFWKVVVVAVGVSVSHSTLWFVFDFDDDIQQIQ